MCFCFLNQLEIDKIEDAGGVRRHVASKPAIPLITKLELGENRFDQHSDVGVGVAWQELFFFRNNMSLEFEVCIWVRKLIMAGSSKRGPKPSSDVAGPHPELTAPLDAAAGCTQRGGL